MVLLFTVAAGLAWIQIYEIIFPEKEASLFEGDCERGYIGYSRVLVSDEGGNDSKVTTPFDV